MGKGKSKRRRQANYLASHGGHEMLPPPPSSSDLSSIPAKLRRIMELKASSSSGSQKFNHKDRSNFKVLKSVNGISKGKKKSKEFIESEADQGEKQSKALKEPEKDQSEGVDSGVSEKTTDNGQVEKQPSKTKKRKSEQELQMLFEKMGATPIRRGLNEHKKRFLEDKKKKKKGRSSALIKDGLTIHQHEKVRFGETIQEPPKALALPKKANSIIQERLRIEAIEDYRKKKGWTSRPGGHRPPLETIAVEL